MTRANALETVAVNLGDRSYDILIGGGLLDGAGGHIREVVRHDRLLVIADAAVAKLHWPRLAASLKAAGLRADKIEVPPGESSKRFPVFADVLERALALGIDRRTTVVAFGGGVVGDLAGFAAAVLLRGLDFIQIPTTLLAQVDSSVGGKTGINAPQGKNLIGAFHQPRLVLADTDVLGTLTSREFIAGYGEVVKYGLLGDESFFDWLEANGPALAAGDQAARIKAIRRSCEMKADIVARDEKEQGDRALLNLGHTFGHALEAATGYSDRLLHGEGVAVGTALAFETSISASVVFIPIARKWARTRLGDS